MDKILERYERYSYAEKVLISTESEIQVTQKQTGVFLFGCEL
jgi:MADS-box transcription factor